MRISIRWVWGVDKQDSICIMEFLLYTINNNLMLSQNIPFHHKMIIYLNTKMFFLLFFYAYSEICCREDKESFILSATPYLLWPPCWQHTMLLNLMRILQDFSLRFQGITVLSGFFWWFFTVGNLPPCFIAILSFWFWRWHVKSKYKGICHERFYSKSTQFRNL